jgi:hypothetical protein
VSSRAYGILDCGGILSLSDVAHGQDAGLSLPPGGAPVFTEAKPHRPRPIPYP